MELPDTAWGGKLFGICPMFEEEVEEEGRPFWEREEEEVFLGMREASEREEEEDEVERR